MLEVISTTGKFRIEVAIQQRPLLFLDIPEGTLIFAYCIWVKAQMLGDANVSAPCKIFAKKEKKKYFLLFSRDPRHQHFCAV